MKQAASLPIIDFDRCNKCGHCVIICPQQALVMDADGPHFIMPVRCTYCTDCESLCPQGAIQCPLTITWHE